MALPGAGDWRITEVYTGPGTVPICQVWAAESVHTAATIAAAWASAWEDHRAAAFSNTLTLSGLVVKQGPDATGLFIVTAPGLSGDLAGDTESPQVAILVRKNSNVGGRANRGRSYQPGVIAGETTVGGTLSGTYQTLLQTAYDDFMDDLNAGGIDLAIEHANGDPLTPMQSMSIDSTVATQRRRVR